MTPEMLPEDERDGIPATGVVTIAAMAATGLAAAAGVPLVLAWAIGRKLIRLAGGGR